MDTSEKKQSKLYAHFVDGCWKHVTRSIQNTRFYDRMPTPTEPIFCVFVVEQDEGDYWSWWDCCEGTFYFTHWRREGVTTCFPSQIEFHEKRGEGRLLKVTIICQGLAWNPKEQRKGQDP